MPTPRQRLWGWFFFDWASQPYATLLLTFIFAPYITEVLGDGTKAQAAWGYGVACAGIVIAVFAPVLGAVADTQGRRLPWIWAFSALYIAGAAGLWFAAPGSFNLILILVSFGIGLIGLEFATIFTNAMLPSLGSRSEIGRISGNGWAFGYVGGLLALVITLGFFAESAATGKTFLGLTPVLGLDPAQREGTRAVGPFVAVWFAVFMVPFFLFVSEDPRPGTRDKGTGDALTTLWKTLVSLPSRPSLLAYLASSMFYRDALNGIYTFGGLYAAGVLGWSVVDTGIFGLIAIVAGAVFAWLGGRADAAFGPKPVIVLCIVLLTLAATFIVFVSPDRVLWITVAPGASLPDVAFYAAGSVIGAAGGALASASRTLMVHQAKPERMTEAFGLYALAGKATSFLAPLSIGIVTSATGSQQWGVTPIIVLFLLGLLLLFWVQPEGDRAA